jgi:triacylglycerol esterase/lipase EstA (alpha/beta hydrolase family)
MRHRTIGAIAFTVVVLASAASPALAGQLPVIYNGIYGYAQVSSTASPPGANNWSCKPSAAHPDPVILVHGTFADMSDSWQALSPLLYDNGYCVFALNYGAYNGSGTFGVYATGPIAASAQQLSAFVDRILAATGASRVDLIGHSQGGMMPRYYINFLGGASKVRMLVGLAPSNHGTTLNGIFTLASYFPDSNAVLVDCPACQEQEAGSLFLTHLNGAGETNPNVNYTVIESANDEVVTPYTSAFLAPGPNVKNILLQRQCGLDDGDHLSMAYDHIADADVLSALDPTHPRHPACTPVLPVSGG